MGMTAEMHWKLHAAAAFDEEKPGVTSGSAYLSNKCNVVSVDLLIKALGHEVSHILITT